MRFLACFISLAAIAAQAQLAVSVTPVEIVGQKAVIPLSLTNNLTESIESARAICFLLDSEGKMVGQSSKWVIGGSKDRPALQPKSGTTYNFVITSPQPFTTTNLTAKVNFTRIVLAGQKLADPRKDVQIQNTN